MESIIALSSGGLPSGVAVIRISGPDAKKVLHQFGVDVPLARMAKFCVLKDDQKQVLDEALVLFFPGPNSFNGEDIVEVQCHGSQAVVQKLIQLALQVENVRLAEPGEFSQRAFENGKLDLIEVEGLGDLLDAKTENQRELAIQRLRGGLSAQVDLWRHGIINILAEIEARLDFSDEGDVEDDLPEDLLDQIKDISAELVKAADGFEAGQIMRDGLRVALVGRPNVGKSTLLNALAKSDRAIVTDVPGTTRDVIEIDIDIKGQLFTIFDTAGIRPTDDVVEIEGISRSYQVMERAHLVIELLDGANPAPQIYPKADWVIVNKVDQLENFEDSRETVVISAKEQIGIGDLLQRLSEYAAQQTDSRETALISHQRDKSALQDASSHLQDAANFNKPLELVAEDLRLATHKLSRLIGLVDAEDILNRLFAGFCIGK